MCCRRKSYEVAVGVTSSHPIAAHVAACPLSTPHQSPLWTSPGQPQHSPWGGLCPEDSPPPGCSWGSEARGSHPPSKSPLQHVGNAGRLCGAGAGNHIPWREYRRNLTGPQTPPGPPGYYNALLFSPRLSDSPWWSASPFCGRPVCCPGDRPWLRHKGCTLETGSSRGCGPSPKLGSSTVQGKRSNTVLKYVCLF